MDALLKKVVPIEFKFLKNLRPHEKILFVSMTIIENEETAMDPYTLEKIKIKLTTTAPQGILLKVFCFPQNEIVNIIKWTICSTHESNALNLEICKNQKEWEQNVDEILNEAYQELEDDLELSMALEVNYN